MAVGALESPDAARVATVYTNAPKRPREPFSPICVHACVPAPAYNGATVYTNAPKRTREAIFADLCTLFCTPTTARATGRGYGSHDINGPMAP